MIYDTEFGRNMPGPVRPTGAQERFCEIVMRDAPKASMRVRVKHPFAWSGRFMEGEEETIGKAILKRERADGHIKIHPKKYSNSGSPTTPEQIASDVLNYLATVDVPQVATAISLATNHGLRGAENAICRLVGAGQIVQHKHAGKNRAHMYSLNRQAAE